MLKWLLTTYNVVYAVSGKCDKVISFKVCLAIWVEIIILWKLSPRRIYFVIDRDLLGIIIIDKQCQ